MSKSTKPWFLGAVHYWGEGMRCGTQPNGLLDISFVNIMLIYVVYWSVDPLIFSENTDQQIHHGRWWSLMVVRNPYPGATVTNSAVTRSATLQPQSMMWTQFQAQKIQGIFRHFAWWALDHEISCIFRQNLNLLELIGCLFEQHRSWNEENPPRLCPGKISMPGGWYQRAIPGWSRRCGTQIPGAEPKGWFELSQELRMRLVAGLFDGVWRFTSMVTMVSFWRVLVSRDSHCFFCRVLGYDTFFLHMLLP